jgi:hypothetical protein
MGTKHKMKLSSPRSLTSNVSVFELLKVKAQWRRAILCPRRLEGIAMALLLAYSGHTLTPYSLNKYLSICRHQVPH